MIREDVVRVETTTASSAPPPTSGGDYDIHQVDDAVVHEREYEPDMAQIVESLREDLLPEEQREVPDITRKRKMTTSSSSSSSSDSESEKEVEGIPQETKKITITESVTEVTENGDVGSKDIVDGHVLSKTEETIEKVCEEIIDEKKDERSSTSSSDDENIKEIDDRTVTEVRRESTSSSSSSDDDDSKKPKSTEKSSEGDVNRKEETVEVKREVIEVTKKSDETEEDKTSPSSSDEETTKKEETIEIERVVTEITKKGSFTNEDQVPQPDEKQEDQKDIVEKTRTGSQSSSSSSDDEVDTRPGCEVTITQTTVVKITEERPTKEVKELPSGEQTPPRSRSSSSSSDGKSPELKKGPSSESGGYSSGSSSEGLESKTRIFPEVERQERFELVDKEVIAKSGPISTTEIPDSGI